MKKIWGYFGMVFVMVSASAADWTITTIDTTPSIRETTIQFDPAGNPHIGYWDETNRNLKYAYLDADGWHIETVDAEGDIGEGASMDLDSHGFAHISYGVESNYQSDLKYARKDETGWHIEFVDTEGDVGSASSLAVDSLDRPHISYVFFPGNDLYNLKYAYWNGSDWQIEKVEKFWAGRFPSIQLDENDNPHIAYEGWGVLRYAYRDVSGWQIETADTYGAFQSALALDSKGNPHIAHKCLYPDYAMKYTFKDESGWHSEILHDGDQSASASYASITIDSNDFPHIGFYLDGHYYITGALIYTYQDASGWHTETVDGNDSDSDCGIGNSMILDSNDRPHFSYQGDSYLRYAVKNQEPPPCQVTGVKLWMPSTMYHGGDPCSCIATVCNSTPDILIDYPLFVILDVLGSYFFAPSFSSFDNYLNQHPDFEPGLSKVTVLEEFTWPDNVGSLTNVKWYAGLTDPEITELYGETDTWTFGWN